jgi:hypothetical protein
MLMLVAFVFLHLVEEGFPWLSHVLPVEFKV